MKLLWLVILSIAANAVMAGVWWKRRSSVPANPQITIEANAPATVPKAAAEEEAPAPVVVPAVIGSSTGVAITWKDLAVAELKEFVQKLRAVGCPEETVQDIILAEVNRRYATKTRELWPDRYKTQDFWRVEKQDAVQNKKNRESWRRERELQKEKSALLVELLGVDPEREMRKEEGLEETVDWQERTISYLPPEKRAAVLKYLEERQDIEQVFYEKNRGIWDEQSRADQRQMEAEKLQGLAQLLTPQELREYELRSSQTANQLGHDLRSMALTRDQYESIFDIRKKYGDSIYNYGDLDKAGQERVETTQKEMKAELAGALGDKFKDYERGQDYHYQQLTRLAKRSDLPADTAAKVFDYKQVAEDAVKQLKKDTTLTPDQRQAALQKLQAETKAAITTTLGEKNYKRYQNDGGWWINQLAPPQPPPPKPK